MGRITRHNRTLILATFIVLSLVVGRLIPGFYEWTGNRQSRASPLIAPIALGLMVLGAVTCFVLPFLPKLEKPTPGISFRFNLRTLLIATAVVALCTAAIAKFHWLSYAVGATTLAHQCWLAWRNPRYRFPFAALLACMYLPFSWIVGHKFGSGNVFLMLLSAAAWFPTMLPGMIFARLADVRMHDSMWISVLMTSAELLLGTAVIRLGLKPTIAYLIVVFLVSLFSSFCFHAMVLA